MKYYISGAMSGIEEHNYPTFFNAEKQLHKLGYEAINPARLGFVKGWEWGDYMKRDIVSMMDADGLVLLKGWENSKGANLEVDIALRLEMKVVTLEDLLKENK